MSKILTNFKILFFCYLFLINIVVAADIENNVDENIQQNQEFPSLELLLYLGEFQDKDGSLLEPEKFDKTLKLEKIDLIKTDEETTHENKIPQVTKVKKEDGDE